MLYHYIHPFLHIKNSGTIREHRLKVPQKKNGSHRGIGTFYCLRYMEELYKITGEDFYLELIAKELSGEISELEKSSLRQWIIKIKDNRQMLSSPLLSLYFGIAG